MRRIVYRGDNPEPAERSDARATRTLSAAEGAIALAAESDPGSAARARLETILRMLIAAQDTYRISNLEKDSIAPLLLSRRQLARVKVLLAQALGAHGGPYHANGITYYLDKAGEPARRVGP